MVTERAQGKSNTDNGEGKQSTESYSHALPTSQ